MTNLKKHRIEKGFSQSQLAELAGMSLRTLQHYEQGERDINKAQAGTLLRIARALDCTIEDLLEEEREQEVRPTPEPKPETSTDEPLTSFEKVWAEAYRQSLVEEIRANMNELERFKERMKKKKK